MGAHLDVEPNLQDDGGIVSVVVDISIICPGANMCQTTCYKLHVTTDVQLTKDMSRVTLFHVKIHHRNGRIWLLATDDTIVRAHESPCLADIANVVELCAGIGAINKGYQFCGGKAMCFL